MATTTEWTTSAAEKWLPLNRDSIAHDGSEVRVLARPQGRRSRALRARSWQDVESSHPPHRRGDLVFSQWARRDVAPAERKRDDGAGRRRRLPDDPTLPVRTLMQPPDLQAHAARGTGRHDGRKSASRRSRRRSPSFGLRAAFRWRTFAGSCSHLAGWRRSAPGPRHVLVTGVAVPEGVAVASAPVRSAAGPCRRSSA